MVIRRTDRDLTNTLRTMRRSGKIHPHIGIFLPPAKRKRYKEIAHQLQRWSSHETFGHRQGRQAHLSVEVGEKIHKKFLSWNDLLYMGMIELIDANEEENCFISSRYSVFAKLSILMLRYFLLPF